MKMLDYVPVESKQFIIMMSSCCFGWHISAKGTKKWDKGCPIDMKGDILDDGSLLISNRYENDEIYFYFLSPDGKFSLISMDDLDKNPDFLEFLHSN